MAFPVFTLISCILIFILLIAATFAIIYYIQRQNAFNFVSPWCWKNWQCNGTGYNPVDAFMAVIEACKPDPNNQGKVDQNRCNCAISGWQNFYNPNQVDKNPPTTPVPNNCLPAPQ
jgi:hypothetical protein